MIIDKFDGKINFLTKWKKGSSFFFTMGIDDYEPESLSKISSDKSKPLSQKRILVVDDEDFILQSMGRLLMQAGVDSNSLVF